jgi:Tol biopolymer transport system component
VAVAQPDRRTGNRDIWLLDLPRGIPTRYTTESSQAFYPVWSPDGRALAFASDRNGAADIYVKAMTGANSEAPRLVSPATTYPHDWARDGRLIFIRSSDIWVISGDADSSAVSLGETDFEEDDARFSPDGRWLSFTSNELGNYEVYVRSIAIDAAAGPSITRVSVDGGSEPRWSENGKELFYLDLDRRLMAVELELAPSFKASVPVPLFESCASVKSGGRQSYDVTADGERFLFICRSTETPAAQIHVVINWFEKLNRLVPTDD